MELWSTTKRCLEKADSDLTKSEAVLCFIKIQILWLRWKVHVENISENMAFCVVTF